MKPWIKFTAVLLCICLMACFNGCESEPDVEATVNTTAPTETTAAPTEPDPATIYDTACEAIRSQANLVIRFDYTHERTIAGERYTETSTGSAYYKNLGTDEMEALVSEELNFSGYETSYTCSYLSGAGYCRVNNSSYICEMTPEDFIAQQLPAILLDAALYGTVERKDSENGNYTISFANPQRLESWVRSEENINLTNAYGSAQFNSADTMTGASYYAVYTVGNVVNTVSVSYTIETPTFINFSSYQPVYPESCPSVSDLSIPRLMLQVVGDLYATDNMTASYSDLLYSEAFAVVRSQSGNFDTYGQGEDFCCRMDTQVTVTDYTGTSNVNSQSIIYQDGIYSYATNGGEMTATEGIAPETVRISCEDSILSSLFEFEHIALASMTDTGDFLRIDFTGNETYIESLFDSIYALFSLDLDSYADSFTEGSAGGYLYINKYSGLPTSLGINLERSHTIAGVDYALTYQLDQAMELPSKSSCVNITGHAEASESTGKTATPLFYKVTGANGETLWLLGTIHAGDERTGNLPAEITAAFHGCDALAVEFDTSAFEKALSTDASLVTALTEAYYYSEGGKYSDHLSKSLRNSLKQLIYASGNNSSNAPYMKAGIWNSLIENFYLQQGSNLSADLGVDARLLAWASEQGKPVYEIESGLSQIQMISEFSDDLQSALLADTLELGLLGYCKELQELYELWCTGDAEALTAYLTTDTSEMSKEEKALYKEYTKVMTTDRNENMHRMAVSYLESGETVFYAVGLAHLLGEDGLVQSLQDAGYTVEQVTYN